MPTNASSPIRFGLIACSSVARRRFAPALLSSGSATLERAGSRSALKSAAFAAEFCCVKSGSYEDVLHDPDVDCVYISTPPTEHAKWAIAAARHGKHVLCEKPAAMNMREALAVLESCRSNDVCFLEGYAFAFHPQHAEFKKLIREGAIGSPRLFTAQFSYPMPSTGDYRFRKELGGGVFFDSAGYTVAAALMTIESHPAEVFTVLENDKQLGVDVGTSIFLRFGSGETAQLYSGMGLQYRSRYAAHGSRGRIELERAFSVSPDHETVIRIENDEGLICSRVPRADQFAIMIGRFAAATT